MTSTHLYLVASQPMALSRQCENTVVPRLTRIICSSKITVERNRRQAKVKIPLKCIENRSNAFQWAKYFIVKRRSSTGEAIFDRCLPLCVCVCARDQVACGDPAGVLIYEGCSRNMYHQHPPPGNFLWSSWDSNPGLLSLSVMLYPLHLVTTSSQIKHATNNESIRRSLLKACSSALGPPSVSYHGMLDGLWEM